MRRITWIVAVMMCVSVFLAGCGKKDAEAVVKDLDHVISKLDSYEGTGVMVLHTGQQPQEYQVDIWYKKPHYYRIALTNEKKDVTQIVLRNDDGVFVLTPHLNKSFRFQSNWPENQGQVYLYQTLVQSILMDNERHFAEEKENYVFDVVANYQNGSLARQKIWLNKDSYAPKHVEVSDDNQNVLVEVKFSQFAFGKKFEKDSFDMQRNMTSWNLESLTAMAEEEALTDDEMMSDTGETSTETDGVSTEESSSEQQNTLNEMQGDFGIIEPTYLPEGVQKGDIREMELNGAQAVMLRYTGDYSFTLVEARPKDRAVSAIPGTLMDLGYTMGILTGDERKTLIWMHEGVEFRLSSADLPQSEMYLIAQSVQGQVGK